MMRFSILILYWVMVTAATFTVALRTSTTLSTEACVCHASPSGGHKAQYCVTHGAASLRSGSCSFFTVHLAAGVYHEHLDIPGTHGAPLRLMGPEHVTDRNDGSRSGSSARAVLSGTERVTTPWTHVRGKIYKTMLNSTSGTTTANAQQHEQLQQVFLDGGMLVEARWPKATADQMLDVKTWARTQKGSVYGLVVDDALAATGIDFSGALATLQVGEMFYTYSRDVLRHTAGSNNFSYADNFPSGIGPCKPNAAWCFVNGKYYLSGILAALTQPGEWYFDTTTGELYVWTPDSDTPAAHMIETKTNAHAFCVLAENHCENLELSDIDFVGCTFSLKCNTSTVVNSTLMYPSYNRRVVEMDVPRSTAHATQVMGDGNRILRTRIMRTNNNGICIFGDHNLVQEVLVNDTDWLGTLTYAPMFTRGHFNTVNRSSVSFFGNAGIHMLGAAPGPPPLTSSADNTVSYCHISFGGLIGLDTALLYTGSPLDAGTLWHHNWVHDAIEKCMRGDDQSRNMTIHHNVVWNCGVPQGDQRDAGWGLIIKGNDHRIFSNTFFATQQSSVCLPGCAEPLKKWLPHQWPLLKHQNNDTLVANNAVLDFTGFPCSCHHPGPAGGKRTHNFKGTLAEMKLRDAHGLDFRPQEDSPLVGAGEDGGDIGAYSHDAVPWTAGCTLWQGC